MPPSQEGASQEAPVDPDATRAEAAATRRHPRLRDVLRERWDVVGVIAIGGMLGSLGRWGVAELLPHDAGAFAWSTFAVNVSGAFVLGLLMTYLADVLAATRYVRPLLGVGLLGGWTTFSTYMVDTRAMLADGRVAAGLLVYLGGTLVVGLVAVWAGLVTGRTTLALRRRAMTR